MTIESKVTRRFPDNTVQVDMKVNNSIVRHFKMPENQVDSFTSEYKKNDTNTRIFATIALVGLSLGCGFIGSACSKHLLKIENKIASFGLTIASAMLGCFGSTKLTEHKMIKDEKKLLNNHNASQIFYENGKII